MRLKWKLVSVRLWIANLDTKWVHVCVERTIGLKSYWTHLMEIRDDMAHVESCLGSFRAGVSFGAR
jgi:hypothetical protein